MPGAYKYTITGICDEFAGFYPLRDIMGFLQHYGAHNLNKNQGRQNLKAAVNGIPVVHFTNNRMPKGVRYIPTLKVAGTIQTIIIACDQFTDRNINIGNNAASAYASSSHQQANDSARAIDAAIRSLREYVIDPANHIYFENFEGEANLAVWEQPTVGGGGGGHPQQQQNQPSTGQ